MSSTLLDELPAIYREDAFLGRFLLAFEKILLGIDDGVPLPPTASASPGTGIEQTIAGLARWFQPQDTPAEFLPWLASWVALSLRADLDEKRARDFLANVVSHYRRRGTARNLEALLAIFTVGTPTVTTGDSLHHFTVTIRLPPIGAYQGTPANYAAFIERQVRIARALIELEKPAHTRYTLNPVFPSLQIGVWSTVGVDTLLGSSI